MYKISGIVELLENIIVRLRPRIIILSRRVSRQFRDTIDGSTAIKRVAFLVPGQAPMSFSTGLAINPIFASRGLWRGVLKKLSTSRFSFDFISLCRTEPLIDWYSPWLGSKPMVKLYIENLRWKSDDDRHSEVSEDAVVRQPSGEVLVVCSNDGERLVTAATLEEAINEFALKLG